jgi:hypothetical protein
MAAALKNRELKENMAAQNAALQKTDKRIVNRNDSLG